MSGVPSHRSELRRVLTAAFAVGALVLGGAAGLFGYAAGTIDTIERESEIRLAGLRLARMQEKTLEDVQSATVWNDAVSALGRADLEWMQENFGDYYADYMGHDVTLVFDSTGQMVLASRESEPVAAEVEAGLTETVLPMVQALQAVRPDGYGFGAAQHRTAVETVGDATYLVAASTVVPEDDSVARPQQDPVVVSALNITAVVHSLSTDLALQNPMFRPAARSGQAALPVVNGERQPLGVLSWTPSRPGERILAQAAPLLIGLMGALIGCGVVLWVMLDRIARRMDRQQMEVADARDRAEAANEAKTRFLANISHELRTPLNGVLGMAEIMRHGELSALQRGHLQILKASGDDLLGMIENILLVTRLERAEVDLEAAPFDLDGLLTDVADQTRSAIGSRPVAVVVDSGAAGEWVGDVCRVRQILDCLLQNAAAFTVAGEVRVVSEETPSGVNLIVSDTGTGIDPEFLPRLFDEFAQADESVTRNHEGAGLGLAVCRRLVIAMGGTIEVDSAPGEGTTFTVALPLERLSSGPLAAAA